MHISLDLETMGTRSDAAIVAIGAIVFDLTTMSTGDKFYTAVDLQSSIDAGGTTDEATIKWWKSQKQEAKDALQQNPQPIRQALAAFTEFVSSHGTKSQIFIWGNGSDFDNVILISAYQRLGVPLPWSWQNNRCYRTIRSLYPSIKKEKTGTAHNALDDAESQAKHMIAMLNPWGQSALKIPA
jgi:hypothetical protein